MTLIKQKSFCCRKKRFMISSIFSHMSNYVGSMHMCIQTCTLCIHRHMQQPFQAHDFLTQDLFCYIYVDWNLMAHSCFEVQYNQLCLPAWYIYIYIYIYMHIYIYIYIYIYIHTCMFIRFDHLAYQALPIHTELS